jgi:hypothetical protein
MQSIKDEAISAANLHIQNLETGIDVLNSLPELCNVHRLHVSEIGGDVYIVTMYDLATYRRNRKKLHDGGWKIVTAFTVPSGKRYAHLEKDGHRISYIMESDIYGSTCKKTKIAEEITDIYQVVCH